MKQRSLFIALLAVVAILCLLFLGRQNSKEGTRYQHNEGTIFGTLYHTKYLYGTDLQAELEAELQKVDASLSMFNPQSTISRINRNETDEVDEMLREVMELSFTIYKATDGAFDPTVAPLVNAWGFGFKSGNLPDSTQVDSLLALVGLSHVHLNGNKLIKDNPLTILDFSAIAKGYGVDRAAQVLRNHNIKNFMVEIGGEIIAEGVNADRSISLHVQVEPGTPVWCTSVFSVESAPAGEPARDSADWRVDLHPTERSDAKPLDADAAGRAVVTLPAPLVESAPNRAVHVWFNGTDNGTTRLEPPAESEPHAETAEPRPGEAGPLPEGAAERSEAGGVHTQRTQRAQSPDDVHQLPLPPMSTNANANPNPARLPVPLTLSLLTVPIGGH